MTQSTLVETCRYNLQTALLVEIGVAEYRTWKQQLVLQGEQMEEIIARVQAEEKESRDQRKRRDAPQNHLLNQGEMTLATEAKSPSKSKPARGGNSS